MGGYVIKFNHFSSHFGSNNNTSYWRFLSSLNWTEKQGKVFHNLFFGEQRFGKILKGYATKLKLVSHIAPYSTYPSNYSLLVSSKIQSPLCIFCLKYKVIQLAWFWLGMKHNASEIFLRFGVPYKLTFLLNFWDKYIWIRLFAKKTWCSFPHASSINRLKHQQA